MATGWGIQWTGLTSFLKLMGTAKQNSKREMGKMTAEVGQAGFAIYQENLSGSQPSTSSQPLPVGVVSGELLASATLTLESMSFRISNFCGHAAYIEFGTSKMTARRPLWDAVQQMEGLVPTAQQKAVRMIFGE